MRGIITGTLFALALLLAACGGGGGGGTHSAFLPSSTPTNNPGAKTRQATIALYVPPANKQNARSKPLYIPGNTQEFGVFVEAYPSVLPSIGPSSTPPPGIVYFPVATPSPCAAASGGAYTCTLTVTAPIGTDLFVVAAFAQASPNPSQPPISAFLSGPVTVSLSPSPGATPLSFTLNGVINSVAVTVASPDPGNTPNTQVFTVGVATSAPIALNVLDSTGNQVMSPATLPFFNPVVIQASPAADGLTFSLAGTSVCGSSASGATATINCAGDLGDVQVTYDGTPRPDASDHLIDAYTVLSTTAPNPTPSPANFVLQSNVENFALIPSSGGVSPAYIMRDATGKFVYIADLYNLSEWELGTFDPSTTTPSAPVQLTTASDIVSAALSPNGDVWVDDDGPLDCYTQSGGSAVVTGLYPTIQVTSPPDSVYPTAITVDTAGNLWYVGYDESTSQEYAGYANASSGCSSGISSFTSFALSGDLGDDSPTIAALPSGGVVVGTGANNKFNVVGVYVVSTGGSSSLIGSSLLASAFNTYGVAGDNAGNIYAGFAQNPGAADIEKLAGGSAPYTEIAMLPPSPGPLPSPEPSGLNLFSISGAADRAMYADNDYAALGIVESANTSPLPILVSLPNAYEIFGTVYNKNGGEYAITSDVTANNFNLTRAMPTRTWSVANEKLASGCSGTSALLTVLERGDSGPFTVSIPAGDGSATQFPNADHDFYLSLSNSAPFAIQVTDAHGRTETYTITTTSGGNCGVAHRRLTHAHVR